MKLSPAKISLISALGLAAVAGVYILSILWRVSLCEQSYFGRSFLIPLKANPPRFTGPPTADSFGDGTYTYMRPGSEGETIKVYKQLANAFQHSYASALAGLEIGELPADLLFRANEYVEAVFCKNASTNDFFLDTKKDLANNAAGREIALRARSLGLSGAPADLYLQKQVLAAMAKGTVINHYRAAAVTQLPSLASYGCPLLAGLQKKHL